MSGVGVRHLIYKKHLIGQQSVVSSILFGLYCCFGVWNANLYLKLQSDNLVRL